MLGTFSRANIEPVYVSSNTMESSVSYSAALEAISLKEQLSGVEQERTKLDPRVDDVIFFLAFPWVIPISHGKGQACAPYATLSRDISDCG